MTQKAPDNRRLQIIQTLASKCHNAKNNFNSSFQYGMNCQRLPPIFIPLRYIRQHVPPIFIPLRYIRHHVPPIFIPLRYIRHHVPPIFIPLRYIRHHVPPIFIPLRYKSSTLAADFHSFTVYSSTFVAAFIPKWDKLYTKRYGFSVFCRRFGLVCPKNRRLCPQKSECCPQKFFMFCNVFVPNLGFDFSLYSLFFSPFFVT